MLLVVFEAEEPHYAWAIPLFFVFIEIDNGHLVHIEAEQSFGPAGRNCSISLPEISCGGVQTA